MLFSTLIQTRITFIALNIISYSLFLPPIAAAPGTAAPAAAPGPAGAPPLIKHVCQSGNPTFDADLCVRLLKSNEEARSAADFHSLAMAIGKQGISHVNRTREHVENMFNKTAAGGAIEVCRKAYGGVMVTLKSAVNELKDPMTYNLASYDMLLAGTDSIGRCQDAVRRDNVTDEVVLSGNKAVVVFGLSGNKAVDEIRRQDLTNYYIY
ncbi:uncharacterized protein LOC127257354 [Andrographis paniculata]|uniref:uncharacterized protein LOC127257354 n=1 Tax=Andrographis paniculata TaxID=175694 RepID=UPI0021E8D8CB|nr:uncharacterized protein LOC127257354 [Andrographis paniculata]